MEPFSFILGTVAFKLIVDNRTKLRKAAVFTAGKAFSVAEQLKCAGYELKEEFEDIVAEGHYEYMKTKENCENHLDMEENDQSPDSASQPQ